MDDDDIKRKHLYLIIEQGPPPGFQYRTLERCARTGQQWLVVVNLEREERIRQQRLQKMRGRS